MKKSGFTYIELIFSMLIVVILMVASLPLLTRKDQTTFTGYGEYQCVVRPDSEGRAVMYQRSRFNTDDFATPFEQVNTCVFSKPVGVTNFKVLLFGGGSGGGSFLLDESAVGYGRELVVGSSVGMAQTLATGFPSPFVSGKYLTYDGLGLTVLLGYANRFIYAVPVDLTNPTGAKTSSSYLVDGYRGVKRADTAKLIKGRAGNKGKQIEFNVNVGSLPFAENGQMSITSCEDTNINNVTNPFSACLASPASDGVAGRLSYLRIDNPMLNILPNANCSVVGTDTLCYALGGDAPSTAITADRSYEQPTVHDSPCLFVIGETGASNAVGGVNLAGGVPFTPADCNLNRAQMTPVAPDRIGVGGAGASAIIKMNSAAGALNFQRYNILQFQTTADVWLDENNSLYLQGNPYVTQDISFDVVAGRGGSGGGGAIYIRW